MSANRIFGPWLIGSFSTSSRFRTPFDIVRTGEVSVANTLRTRSVAPRGPVPAITECLEASAAFSIAMKKASRLPLPA